MSCNPTHQTSSGSLLLDLHRAHEDVLGCMERLGRLTHACVPDEQAIGNARWKLSGASMRRRLLWVRILGHLAPVVDQGARDELLRLQNLDVELLGASTEHIKRWTIDAIVRDWPGYCAASRQMRCKMIARMEAEKRILYPLLRADHAQPISGGSPVRDAIGKQTRLVAASRH